MPHGPLIEIELLDKVVEKLKDTYDKKKRSGRDNHIYLLSNLLFFEDDTSFGGQPGKNREYRYYYNKKNKIRIRCDELDPIIIRRFKSYVKDHDLYQGLVQQAIRRRQTNLPKVDAQIQTLRKALADLDDGEAKLRGELFKPGQKGDGFMPWLEEQVSETKKQREQKLRDLDALERARKEVLEQAGLSDLDKLLKEFMDGFDDLTPVQQRNFVEKFIKKIVVKPGNKIDLHLYGESPLGAKRKKSTDSDLYGRGGGQSRNPL